MAYLRATLIVSRFLSCVIKFSFFKGTSSETEKSNASMSKYTFNIITSPNPGLSVDKNISNFI